jgi:hypothetical protein
MKYLLVLLVAGIVFLVIPESVSQPSFNDPDPGCSGSGCHSFQAGIVSASVSGMDVTITLNGTSSAVAGELVDSSRTVVAVNNLTSSNPFTLTAPGPGVYTVNAGYKNPSRKWDSTVVVVGVTGIEDHPSNPDEYKLYNNYPNPFNPATILSYSLPQSSFTTLKIYDVIGNEVAVLVNEIQTAGTHQVVFNAVSLPSGVYLYSLQAGSFKQTKKMILMK